MTVDIEHSYPLPEAIDRHGNYIWLQGVRVTDGECMATMTHWDRNLNVNYTALLYLRGEANNTCHVEIVRTLRSSETHGQNSDVFSNFMSVMTIEGLVGQQSDHGPGLGWWKFGFSKAGRRWFRSI